jgi:hypothetical protein
MEFDFENMDAVARVVAIRAQARAAGIVSNGDPEYSEYVRMCEKMPPAEAMRRAIKGE